MAQQPNPGNPQGPQPGRPGPAPQRPAGPAPETGRRRPIGVREELEEMRDVGGLSLAIREFLHDSPAFAVSAVVHMIAVLILFFITLGPEAKKVVDDLVAVPEEMEEEEPIDELPNEEPELTELDKISAEDLVSPVVVENVEVEEMFEFDEPAPEFTPELDTGLETAPRNEILSNVGKVGGKGFDGRGSAASRKAAVAKYGGTEGSEAAVAMALKWIAAHQMPDGGWDFNHGKTPLHQGPVNNPGEEKSRTGATAMALLPFLGAGQTHMEGEYKEVVRRGLTFMGMQAKPSPNGVDLRGGGTLYSHGLAAITLCEAYAMTQDRELMGLSQGSLNFITHAQDKVGGGWRYTPGQPGDTSVVGWQIMALKSGHLAYLVVDKRTIAGAINFLNIVQQDSGAYYGYTSPGKGPATTAVGLLCRMYLGWKQDEPALQRGVEHIGKMGPSPTNMYFNYYATQVMRHWGDEEWEKWNEVMRDQLVNSQIKAGTEFAEKGSWTPKMGGHIIDKGGRLYETSMCCMTLEVYYRHLPIYQEQVSEDDF